MSDIIIITGPGLYRNRDNMRATVVGKHNDAHDHIEEAWTGYCERHHKDITYLDPMIWTASGTCLTPHKLSYQPRRYDLLCKDEGVVPTTDAEIVEQAIRRVAATVDSTEQVKFYLLRVADEIARVLAKRKP